jgi:hypothetical protein
VNLGFNRGTTLADPQRVLVGTGKSVRHIRLAGESDLRPFLRRYVRAAIAHVGGPGEAPAGASMSVVKGNYPKKRRPKQDGTASPVSRTAPSKRQRHKG